MHTTLCYIERDGCYLMMLRNKKDADPSHGKWIGVGGKFLPGETADECLLREVREETGFTLTSWRSRGIVDFISDEWEEEIMHLYTADGFDVAPGTPTVENLAHAGKTPPPGDAPCSSIGGTDNACDTFDGDKTSLGTRSTGDDGRADDVAADGLPLPPCDEGELAWIPKCQVMSLNLWEGDRLFLQRLIDDEPDATMTLRYEGDNLAEVKLSDSFDIG